MDIGMKKKIVEEFLSTSDIMYPMEFEETEDQYYDRILGIKTRQAILEYICDESHNCDQKCNFKYSGLYGGKRCTKCNKFFR